MPLSMSQASSPDLSRSMLNSLSGSLDKAAAHCQAKGIDPSELVGRSARAGHVPASPARCRSRPTTPRAQPHGSPAAKYPKFEDTETTFDELKARIAKTLDFIKSVPAREIDGSEDKDVTLTVGGQPRTLKGQHYLVRNALPNFFFHVTTAYDILRHKGVEIGKRDYLGTY